MVLDMVVFDQSVERYVRFLQRHWLVVSCLALFIVWLFLPVNAFANGNGGSMPFDDTLNKIRASATGPLAAGLAIVGVIVAGGTLIFGGEIGGFFKSLMFIVLVASMLVGGDNILNNLQVSNATGLGAGIIGDSDSVVMPAGGGQ
jgi:type IV secretion system protein VirB2